MQDLEISRSRWFDGSMVRWGQIQPIQVRPGPKEGQWTIVDGERRWRALRSLAKQHEGEARFQTIRAFRAFDEVADHEKARRAVQLVSNTSEPLTPTEKPMVIRDLRVHGGMHSTDDGLQRTFGLSKGQLRYLMDLAHAPDAIKAFGMPRVYTVPMVRNDSPVFVDGKLRMEQVRRPPLGLILLGELHRLYRTLQRHDADRFRATRGLYQPVAEVVVRKIGESAQMEEWSHRKLKSRCDVTRINFVEGKKPKIRHRIEAKLWTRQLQVHLTRVEPVDLAEGERQAALEALRAFIARLTNAGPVSGNERPTPLRTAAKSIKPGNLAPKADPEGSPAPVL
jgi:hypothetical protein